MAFDPNSFSEVLAKGTGNRQSKSFEVRASDDKVTVLCAGIATGETGVLQISYDNGTTWEDCYRLGVKVVGGVDANQYHPIVIDSPGVYRVNLTSTGSVGVFIKKGNF